MRRLFTILVIVFLGEARASGFTVGPTFGLFSVGGQISWESDARIGARLGVTYGLLSPGPMVSLDVYQAFGEQLEIRLGGGLTWLQNSASGTLTNYLAVSGLIAVLIPVEQGWSLMYEGLLSLVAYRSTPNVVFLDQVFRFDEILASQINVGLIYRF